MNLREKLLVIQTKLKAPKSQFNKFGGYNYRSCEDILEALKPLLEETRTVVILKDKVVKIGNRFYVKASASLLGSGDDGEDYIEVSAYAREEETKKGMDGSQITGAASSYARKYALNGLFGIDDAKDSDTTNQHEDKAEVPEVIREVVREVENEMTESAPRDKTVCSVCGAPLQYKTGTNKAGKPYKGYFCTQGVGHPVVWVK